MTKLDKPPSISDLISNLSKDCDIAIKSPIYCSGSYGDDIRELQDLIGQVANILEQKNKIT